MFIFLLKISILMWNSEIQLVHLTLVQQVRLTIFDNFNYEKTQKWNI